MFNLVVCLSLCLAFVVESFVSIRSACHVIRIRIVTFIWYNRIFQIQVTVKLSELKTTVDIGLLHRGRLLETIGEHYEQWNHLVGLQLFSQWSLFIICLGIWIILTQIYGICVLQNVAQCQGIWQSFFVLMKVRKEKAIHHTLNMLSLDVTKKCLVAEGWSPIFASKQVSTSFFNFFINFFIICILWCVPSGAQFELKGFELWHTSQIVA